MNILIADDDADFVDVTGYALRREGHTVHLSHDGALALDAFIAERPDVMLISSGLPTIDGFDLCRRVRETSDVPLIMLADHSAEWAMVRAFDLGVDDYIIKPLSFRALVLRIGAVARRAQGEVAPETRTETIALDSARGGVATSSTKLQLTRLESRVLHCLLANYGYVTRAERLLQFAWSNEKGDVGILRTHISHLRRKLRLDTSGAPLVIENLHGIGYRLRHSVGAPIAASGEASELTATRGATPIGFAISGPLSGE